MELVQKRLLLIIVVLSFVFISCDKGNPTFNEVQKSSGQYGTEGEFAAQNERALQLEKDLARRHRFFQALKGVYEGTFQTGEKIRLTLVPSLPPYPVDLTRVRTVEEVTSDLNSLHFKVQVQQWNPANKLAIANCVSEYIHPDMNQGTISIVGGTCESYYELLLSSPEKNESSNELQDQAANMSESILEGTLISVSQLRGVVQPSSNAERYEYIVNRIE